MPEQREAMQRLGARVKLALEEADLTAYGELLDPGVRWGPPEGRSPVCKNREQVLRWYQRGQNSGTRAQVSEVSVIGDRLLVGLSVAGTPAAKKRGGRADRWQVLTVRDGRIVEIVGFEERSQALARAGDAGAGFRPSARRRSL